MRPVDGDALKRRAQKAATEAWKMKIEAKVETILNQFIDWINEAPTIQSESYWIPCKKHLPDKELKTYWVCLNNGEQCQCRWTNNIYGFGSIDDKWGWKLIDLPQYTKVVAWRELPESYKEIEDAE